MLSGHGLIIFDQEMTYNVKVTILNALSYFSVLPRHIPSILVLYAYRNSFAGL